MNLRIWPGREARPETATRTVIVVRFELRTSRVSFASSLSRTIANRVPPGCTDLRRTVTVLVRRRVLFGLIVSSIVVRVVHPGRHASANSRRA